MLLLYVSFSVCQSRAFLEPLEIFKGEAEETIEKVEMARKILKHFRDTYEHHRLHIRDYFKEKEPRSWEFAPQLVFHRFDKFVERVEMVHVSLIVCLLRTMNVTLQRARECWSNNST